MFRYALKVSLTSMVAGLALSAPINAQSGPTKAPPAPTDLSAPPGANPEAAFLSESFGISPDEARERIGIMNQVGELVRKAEAEGGTSYAGVWVEHEPVFKVLVAFADQQPRQTFVASLDPQMRRFVQIRNVRAGVRQQQADIAAIFEALRQGGRDFFVAFNPKNQKYEVTVNEGSDTQSVLSAIPPQLRSLVTVQKGPVPKNAQSNVTPGDRVHAGWDALTSTGAFACTFGFAGVNVNNRPAVSTAGHCTSQQPKVVKSTNTAAYVTLPLPFAERFYDIFDFQLHEAVGLDPGYWVWFQNSKPVRGYENYVNTVSGYYSDGYFTVSGVAPYKINNGEHYVDRPVCKSGSRTGFTCGLISSSYVSGTSEGQSFTGMVRVNRSQQMVIAFSGDSGGPVFSTTECPV